VVLEVRELVNAFRNGVVPVLGSTVVIRLSVGFDASSVDWACACCSFTPAISLSRAAVSWVTN
jgi:hypothetical protein